MRNSCHRTCEGCVTIQWPPGCSSSKIRNRNPLPWHPRQQGKRSMWAYHISGLQKESTEHSAHMASTLCGPNSHMSMVKQTTIRDVASSITSSVNSVIKPTSVSSSSLNRASPSLHHHRLIAIRHRIPTLQGDYAILRLAGFRSFWMVKGEVIWM